MARHGKTTQKYHFLFLNIFSKRHTKKYFQNKLSISSLSLKHHVHQEEKKQTSKSVTKPTAGVDDESQNQITKVW